MMKLDIDPTLLTSRSRYPSDISRAQFELIREDLEGFKKHTKPRTVDLYDVFCGILYVLKSGCQWRMLPNDFPKWRTVHEYFLQWGNKASDDSPSLLEQVLKKIRWSGSYKIWTQRVDEPRYR